MSFRPTRFVSRFPPLVLLGLFTYSASALFGQALFVKPVKVLGDPHFIGTAANPTAAVSTGPNVVEGRELQSPEGIALDNSVSPPILYIADTANNRVLAFKYSTQLTPGSFADLILGQPDRFTTTAGGSGGGPTTGMRLPTGLAVDRSGNLYVADTGNNRILRYPSPFAQQPGYQFPDLVIGQTSFSATTANAGGVSAKSLSLFTTSFAGRAGVAIDTSGNLWVADLGNNRVLRFPASVLKTQQFGPSADLAVGQPDLLTTTASTARFSKLGLSAPTGVAFDQVGRLLISDHLGRVLVYPAGVGLNASAIRILGVDTTQTTFAPDAIAINPSQSLTFAGANVIVADNVDHRVMVYPSVDNWPAESTQFSPTAIQVLGQTNFTAIKANQGNGAPGASTLSAPFDVAGSSNELYVADTGNNRVLVYSNGPSGVAQAATRVIGQLDFPYNAPNLVEGKEFNTVAASGLAGSAILDLGSIPPHLYVADTGNNRVLGFRDFSKIQNGQKADLVIGQADFLHTGINYPSGLATQPSSQGFNGPTSLAVDSAGNLYVTDTLNARVMRFAAPFAQGVTAPAANLVLGQSDFSSRVTDPTQKTMAAPISLAFTPDGANTALPNAGFLAVADPSHNRVLFFQKPFSSGMNASIVLGQADFVSSAAGTTPSGLSSPQAVAIDPQNRVIVADAANGRLQVYPAVGTLAPTSTPPSFAITTNLTQPIAIGMATNGQFWVADPGATTPRIVHFTSVDQLPTANPPYSPDTAVPAVSPRSVFVDQYNSLVVADGINRILYFAPQVDAQNAANYFGTSARALAPGTFAAIYPSVKTNVISGDTQINTTLPWPTVTADTQVIVNGSPAALYFVSPGQINFPMPMSLPTGGTVDLQVIRPSTGQVYGAAEIPMASAAPALFVVGGQQSGPVAALNQDNTVNSATNPANRGDVIQLFGTGQGFVANAPPEGQASTGPLPTQTNPLVYIGPAGSIISVPPANVLYSGIAPTLIGVWQINVQIPATAPTGTVPIFVNMNTIPSNGTSVATQIVTTIGIK